MDKELLQRAKKIPSLGMGGISVYEDLIKYAQQVQAGEVIIDIGSWLGSTTVFLMASSQAEIHCYDKWQADEVFRRKAKSAHGIEFKLDEDILPTFKKFVAPFGTLPECHKGDFLKAEYTVGKKIPLIVDDICTGKEMTDHLFDLFEDFMIPDRTIIMMMDYYFFQYRPERCRLYQRDMMDVNVKNGIFKYLGRPQFEHDGKKKDSRTAIFLYLGGKVERIEGKHYYVRMKGQGYIR